MFKIAAVSTPIREDDCEFDLPLLTDILPSYLNRTEYSKNLYPIPYTNQRQSHFQARSMKLSTALLPALLASSVSAYGFVAWNNPGYTGVYDFFVRYISSDPIMSANSFLQDTP